MYFKKTYSWVRAWGGGCVWGTHKTLFFDISKCHRNGIVI